MALPIVVIGVGGFGREVHDVIDAINEQEHTWDLLGYLDDRPTRDNAHLLAARGTPILGGSEWLVANGKGLHYAIGIGSGAQRRAIDKMSEPSGAEAAVLVHPTASLGFGVSLGPGSVICSGARLTTNIRLGRHVHINLNATVGHDSDLYSYVTVNPLVAVSGGVTIREEAMLGTNSAVLQNLIVGERAVVGAASCVVRDVPAGAVVKGVPAR